VKAQKEQFCWKISNFSSYRSGK